MCSRRIPRDGRWGFWARVSPTALPARRLGLLLVVIVLGIVMQFEKNYKKEEKNNKDLLKLEDAVSGNTYKKALISKGDARVV